MTRLALLPALIGAFTIYPTLAAQQPAPAFEVASIKRNDSVPPLAGAGGGATMGRKGQRFTAVNTPLRDIIRYAFDLQAFQNVEGGSRILDDRFDITAVIPQTGSAVDESRLMLRMLLAERFALSARWVTREQQVYALVLARRDGRLGAALKTSSADCAVRKGTGQQTEPKKGAVSAEQLARPTCDLIVQPFRGRIFGSGRTVSDIAQVLSKLPTLRGAVVDRTGLTGLFDFELLYAPEQRAGGADTSGPSAVESQPSLLAALQEQLGLKLESAPGPVEVLVIDSVQQPTPN